MAGLDGWPSPRRRQQRGGTEPGVSADSSTLRPRIRDLHRDSRFRIPLASLGDEIARYAPPFRAGETPAALRRCGFSTSRRPTGGHCEGSVTRHRQWGTTHGQVRRGAGGQHRRDVASGAGGASQLALRRHARRDAESGSWRNRDGDRCRAPVSTRLRRSWRCQWLRSLRMSAHAVRSARVHRPTTTDDLRQRDSGPPSGPRASASPL